MVPISCKAEGKKYKIIMKIKLYQFRPTLLIAVLILNPYSLTGEAVSMTLVKHDMTVPGSTPGRGCKQQS